MEMTWFINLSDDWAIVAALAMLEAWCKERLGGLRTAGSKKLFLDIYFDEVYFSRERLIFEDYYAATEWLSMGVIEGLFKPFGITIMVELEDDEDGDILFFGKHKQQLQAQYVLGKMRQLFQGNAGVFRYLTLTDMLGAEESLQSLLPADTLWAKWDYWAEVRIQRFLRVGVNRLCAANKVIAHTKKHGFGPYLWQDVLLSYRHVTGNDMVDEVVCDSIGIDLEWALAAEVG